MVIKILLVGGLRPENELLLWEHAQPISKMLYLPSDPNSVARVLDADL
jgi:hypothetical protein